MSFPDTGTPEWSIRKLSHFPAKWPYTPENFSRADEAPVVFNPDKTNHVGFSILRLKSVCNAYR